MKKAGNRKIMDKKRAVPGICVAGSLILYLLLTQCMPVESPVSPQGQILRPSYGGEEKSYELLVDGLEEQEVPITVALQPRLYTEQEAMDVFYQMMDQMEDQIRGDNPSLMEVTSDLNLKTRLDAAGVRLRWQSSNPEILNSAGKIMEEIRADCDVTLGVQLSDGIHKADFEMPVTLVPPQRSAEEQERAALLSEIEKLDEDQQMTEELVLPVQYEGKQLQYRVKEQDDYRVVPLLGILLALLLTARERSGEKDKEKKREQELLLDYAELVSKLMVLIGAGMTIRNAWERMVKDYEDACERGRQKRRAAYEEMKQTCHQMANGTPEGTAFRDFGRRCRLQPYLKLSSLLEQNRRAGTKNLRGILQMEMEDAFEMRKNLARRMGEEAGTKLLLPLFMMLGIVMVMIMVPAMLTMG